MAFLSIICITTLPIYSLPYALFIVMAVPGGCSGCRAVSLPLKLLSSSFTLPGALPALSAYIVSMP